MNKGRGSHDPRPFILLRRRSRRNGGRLSKDAPAAARHEICLSSSPPAEPSTRLVSERAGATFAVRMIAFDSAPVLPGFERIGAFIAKKAADTIRKVWMFLVFMCTPFLTALLP
jgi:hypothetical protein